VKPLNGNHQPFHQQVVICRGDLWVGCGWVRIWVV
jgi:hypothetical protein